MNEEKQKLFSSVTHPFVNNYTKYLVIYEAVTIVDRERIFYAVLHRLETGGERERGFVHQDRIDSQERESNGP